MGIERALSGEINSSENTLFEVSEVAVSRDKTPSEFGGRPGKVQADGHELTPAEEARLMRATEPTDPADSVAAALVREWDEEGRL